MSVTFSEQKSQHILILENSENISFCVYIYDSFSLESVTLLESIV